MELIQNQILDTIDKYEPMCKMSPEPLYDEIVPQKDLSHKYDKEHLHSNFDNFEEQELKMENKLTNDNQKNEDNEKAAAKNETIKKAFDQAVIENRNENNKV